MESPETISNWAQNVGDDEFLVFIVAAIMAYSGSWTSAIFRSNKLVSRHRAAFAITRLALWSSLIFIYYVLTNHADESVRGFYFFMYLFLGIGAVRLLGLGACNIFGIRLRADVIERDNTATALLLAAFTLSTGLIYGGSLWGDANAMDARDEGTIWVPIGFFAMGYIIFVFTFLAYIAREKELLQRIRVERDHGAAIAVGIFLLSVAWIVKQAVAGDFYGWIHGLVAVGAVAILLLIHEVTSHFAKKLGSEGKPMLRGIESSLYLLLSLSSWFVLKHLHEWGLAASGL